ncbi:hypothetical protein [Streptomyces sp. NPDC056713]|uniref:hypothetical protein n=1 Tax=Streptomyces sp. NPDC056713 TaxID=3345921 RepID=UPI00368B4C1D
MEQPVVVAGAGHLDELRAAFGREGLLGFAMLLKFFEVEARFPETDREVPAPAVGYVAQQVKLSFGVVAGAGALVALVAYRRQRVDEDGALWEATRLPHW